jgi:MscS family membrane protein
MLLPPIDSIPNATILEATRKEASGITTQFEGPFRWRSPIAQIEIMEILEGERQGQFLFSSSTIRNVSDIYKKIKDLPYRQAEFGGLELEYLSPGLSPGFYENYISASGYLIPQAHLVGRLVDKLPNWFKTMYGQQMVWQWTGLVLCLLLITVVTYADYLYIRRLAKHMKSPLHDWLKVLEPILVLFIVMVVGTSRANCKPW